MTTLPATIPGLLRHCSPITANVAGWGKVSGVVRESDGKLWAHVSVEGGGAFLPQRLDAYPFELDITDPTGFHHALLWLAERLGIDASCGLWWRWSTVYECWRVESPAACWVFGRNAFSLHGRYTEIDVVAGMKPAEALRLAVLAVAGVQA